MKRKHIWMALGAVVILALLFWGYGARKKRPARQLDNSRRRL